MGAELLGHHRHYYLLKHFTHFVDARVLPAPGTCDDAPAFANPDGAIVILVRNELPQTQMVQVQVRDRAVAIKLSADSLGMLALRPA